MHQLLGCIVELPNQYLRCMGPSLRGVSVPIGNQIDSIFPENIGTSVCELSMLGSGKYRNCKPAKNVSWLLEKLHKFANFERSYI